MPQASVCYNNIIITNMIPVLLLIDRIGSSKSLTPSLPRYYSHVIVDAQHRVMQSYMKAMMQK